MLSSSTFQFLKELDANNNKEWFEAHRKNYDSAKKDLVTLVELWIKNIQSDCPDVADNEPSKSVFRINRDVRFSKNKAPYKNNMGAAIGRGGKNGIYVGHYLHIQPGECFYAGGKWMPEADHLKKIRQEIDYNFEEFKSIVENPAFQKTFGVLSTEQALKTAPKGYTPDNPAIEYLKLKSFVAFRKIDEKAIQNKNFVAELSEWSLTLKPFLDFLNRAIED